MHLAHLTSYMHLLPPVKTFANKSITVILHLIVIKPLFLPCPATVWFDESNVKIHCFIFRASGNGTSLYIIMLDDLCLVARTIIVG